VPPYNLIRAPARGYLFVDLSLALLAGFGLQEITGAVDSARVRHVTRQTARVLLVLLAALLLFVLPLFYSQILGTNDPSNRPIIAVDGLNLLAIYLMGAVILLWAGYSAKLRGATLCLAATALMMLDLFGATAGFNPGNDDLTAGYRHPQAVEFLRQQIAQNGPFRISSTTLAWQPDLAAVAGLDDAGGLFDPLQPAGYKKVADALSTGRDPALFDLLNVRYVVSDAKAKAPSASFSEALRTDDGLVLWRNDAALPRARLAYTAQQVSVDAALAAVTAPGFDPAATLLLSGQITPAETGGSGSARVDRYDDDRVSIQVRSDRPAYLVLADTSYPGWVATIDGKRTPIATADGIFRAVSVPAGTHEVVFAFKPAVVYWGFAVAAASLVLLLAGLVIGLIQWRGSRTNSSISRVRDDC
jgi:hypothetical protein